MNSKLAITMYFKNNRDNSNLLHLECNFKMIISSRKE